MLWREATITGQKICNPTQWLETNRQYIKSPRNWHRNSNKKRRVTWNGKRDKVHQNFCWEAGQKVVHQVTRSRYITEPKRMKIGKLLKLPNRHERPERSKYNSREDFRGKTSWYGNTGRSVGKVNGLRKTMQILKFSAELLIAKFVTSITDKIYGTK